MSLLELTAFNSILSPLAVVYRVFERRLDLDLGNQERIPPEPLNYLMARAFGLEARLIARGIRLPFGLSYIAVFRRQASPLRT